jgi:hypothetical protein
LSVTVSAFGVGVGANALTDVPCITEAMDLAESLVYKWHPSVPFAQRFDPVDRHRLQLPLRLRHHMVHVLNMFCLCLMSNHAKAPKFGAFADLGRATTYRTNYCETVGLEAKNTF